MSTIMTRGAKPEILAHTGLRGLGVIGVMMNHFVIVADNAAMSDVYPNFGLILDLFFIMSGFIMSYLYFENFSTGFRKERFGKFLWARFARTYPLHIFALVAIIVMAVIKTQLPGLTASPPTPVFHIGQAHDLDTPFTLLTNIFLVHAWGLSDELSWNYPSWALSAEFSAYLLFPLMCLMIGRLPRVGPFILMGLALVIYVAIHARLGSLNVPGNDGAIRCIPGFAFGAAAYHLSSGIRNVSTPRLHVLQGLALVGAIGLMIYSGNQIIPIFALALLLIVTSENRGWLTAVLNWSPIRYLGIISYTVYVMHIVASKIFSPVSNVLTGRFGVADAWWWNDLRALLLMGFSIAISAVAFRYIEMPARDFLTNWMKRRSATARPAAAELVPAVASAPGETPRG